MSGIFNLFGGTGNAVKEQFTSGPSETLKKSSTDTTIFGGAMAAKNVGPSRSKPKGLSIRSGNDLNISKPNVKQNKSPTNKSPIKGFSKSRLGQNEVIPQLLSRNEAKTSKVQIMKSKQLKALKAKSPEASVLSATKQVEEHAFKKPATPKKSTRKNHVYPEPEKLAFYYDHEKDMEDFCLESEFLKILKLSKNSIKPFEDEGLDSDPETIRPSTPPAIDVVIPAVSDTLDEPSPPELPTLSDDDDF